MDPRLQLLQLVDESRRQLLRVLLHRTRRLSRNRLRLERARLLGLLQAEVHNRATRLRQRAAERQAQVGVPKPIGEARPTAVVLPRSRSVSDWLNEQPPTVIGTSRPISETRVESPAAAGKSSAEGSAHNPGKDNSAQTSEASQGGSTPRPAAKVSAPVPADSAAERSFPLLLIVWLGLGGALAVLFIWYFLLRTA